MKTNFLIPVFVLCSLVGLNTAAHAAAPEDCWVNSRSQIAGQFSVDIDTSRITKEELLTTLAEFSINNQVYATGMPLFMPKYNAINFVIAPNGVTTTYNPDGTVAKEKLGHIEARVDPEVKRLMTLPGVQDIRCNFHAVPHPGVSVSN